MIGHEMCQLRRIDGEHLISILLRHIDTLAACLALLLALALPLLRAVSALRHQQRLSLLVLARHLVQHAIGALDHDGLVGAQGVHVIAAEQAFHHFGVHGVLDTFIA